MAGRWGKASPGILRSLSSEGGWGWGWVGVARKRAARVERAFCVGDPRELGNEKRRGHTANSLIGIYP